MKYTEEDLMNSWGTAKWAHASNALHGQSYTFEANGVSMCHLPSLTGGLDGEPEDPKKDAEFEWAIDFVNDNPANQQRMAPCGGSLEHIRKRARKWKTRFPQHEVVIYSRRCLDAQGRWEDNDAVYDEFFVERL